MRSKKREKEIDHGKLMLQEKTKECQKKEKKQFQAKLPEIIKDLKLMILALELIAFATVIHTDSRCTFLCLLFFLYCFLDLFPFGAERYKK